MNQFFVLILNHLLNQFEQLNLVDQYGFQVKINKEKDFKFKFSLQKIGLSNEHIHYLSNEFQHNLLNINIQKMKKKNE